MLLSTIIPAYNQAVYISKAIDSLLAEKIERHEIIVVNDGSTDNTLEILKKYNDKIKVITQENKGLSGARNTGIKNANGEYIHFLDSDDFMYPNGLCLMLDNLQANPEVDIAMAGYVLVNEKEEEISSPITPKDCLAEIENRLLWTLTTWRFSPHMASMLFRRKIFKSDVFFDETLHAAEDRELWIKFALQERKALGIPEKVSGYRQHGENMCGDPERMLNAYEEVAKRTFSNQTFIDKMGSSLDNAKACFYFRMASYALESKDETKIEFYTQQAAKCALNASFDSRLITTYFLSSAAFLQLRSFREKLTRRYPKVIVLIYMRQAYKLAKQFKFKRALLKLGKVIVSLRFLLRRT